MTAPHVPTDERDRIDFKQHFRQGRWLDEQKPVPICRGKLLIGSFVHIKGRYDLQQEQSLYTLGLIQRHTMPNPRPTVVTTTQNITPKRQASGKRVTVGVHRGGRGIIKKKKKT